LQPGRPSGKLKENGKGGKETKDNRPIITTILSTKRGKGMTNKETTVIETLAEESELVLEDDYEKRDMKERRAVTKNMLYDGSKKLKHSLPKGKKI